MSTKSKPRNANGFSYEVNGAPSIFLVRKEAIAYAKKIANESGTTVMVYTAYRENRRSPVYDGIEVTSGDK